MSSAGQLDLGVRAGVWPHAAIKARQSIAPNVLMILHPWLALARARRAEPIQAKYVCHTYGTLLCFAPAGIEQMRLGGGLPQRAGLCRAALPRSEEEAARARGSGQPDSFFTHALPRGSVGMRRRQLLSAGIAQLGEYSGNAR